MEPAQAALVWILTTCSPGCYIGVENKHFTTKQECREWAIDRER